MSARAALAGALLLASAAAACGGGAPSAPPPAGTALTVDGEPILLEEIEALRFWLLGLRPELGDDTSRSQVVAAALLPRALARHDFPEGIAAAKERALAAMAVLRSRRPFETVQADFSAVAAPPAPVTVSWREIDPFLGAAVFGQPSGYVTEEPVETTYAWVIARVDLPIPEPGPSQVGVILSTIEFPYDPRLTDPDARLAHNADRMKRARYEEHVPGAFRWLPPFLAATLVR